MAIKFDLKLAYEHLRKDAKLAVLVEKHHKEIKWPRESTDPPFYALVRAIIAQMLSAQSAKAIAERVLTLAPNLTPERLHSIDSEELKKCGLSSAKVKSVKNLAARTVGGFLDFEKLEKASDDEVVKALTAEYGIGNWTAQMFLIFSMNRPDVFSPGDAGLRRAFKNIYGKDEFDSISQNWSPYRSIASLLLWRSLENEPMEKKESKKKAPKKSDSETKTKGKGKGKGKEKRVIEEEEEEDEGEDEIEEEEEEEVEKIEKVKKGESSKKRVKVETETIKSEGDEKSTRKTRNAINKSDLRGMRQFCFRD